MVFAAIMVVALVAMFVAAIVVSSQQPEAEPEDTVSGGYVGSWYHVEYDKAYVLTLNGDGTARYYDKTLVQPLMFGKWEVGENMKVSFFEPEGEQPNASAGEEFAFYTTPNEGRIHPVLARYPVLQGILLVVPDMAVLAQQGGCGGGMGRAQPEQRRRYRERRGDDGGFGVQEVQHHPPADHGRVDGLEGHGQAPDRG